jgi:hypothetical protein
VHQLIVGCAWVLHENEQHRLLEWWICNKPQDEPCKFCGKNFTSWKKLTDHSASHMKRISLSVLNLVCQQLTDESKIIGPIEPAPQPTSPQSQEHSSWRSGDSAYFSQTPQSSNQHISPNLQTLLASPEMYTHSPTVEVDQAINTKISSPGPNDYWNTKSFAKPTVEYRSMAVATAAQSGTISEDIWFECPPWPQEEISSVGQDEDRKIWDFMDSTQLEELS